LILANNTILFGISLHKAQKTICYKIGGHGPLDPPGYAYECTSPAWIGWGLFNAVCS